MIDKVIKLDNNLEILEININALIYIATLSILSKFCKSN